MKIGVVGATGYLGAELLRLVAAHPSLDVVALQAESTAGSHVNDVYPGLFDAFGDVVTSYDPGALRACDAVFVALPSGASRRVVPDLVDTVPLVVDLGADFRLKDAVLYERWYGFSHTAPELLERAVFGLVEHNRPALADASLVAAPGCYVTAAALAIAPLVSSGVIERDVIVDAASGTSGAGKEPQPSTHHAAVNENFVAYGVTNHRHTPEIEQATGASVLFTPHLLPMTRGILATIYARPTRPVTTDGVLAMLREVYAHEPFVDVTEGLPATRDTYGSNTVRIGARFDDRSGYLIVFSALDNLTKGGAGQALQAANVALGLDETLGLPRVALLP